ncbi:MAG: hypothetical protein KGM47_17890 [Acidobacteriota bacterium]|nr:hypothetical protein [Acidobacteriota bacterium]
MNPGVVISLSAFGAVIVIVALVCFLRLNDRERETHAALHWREMEHRETVRQLDEALKRLRG